MTTELEQSIARLREALGSNPHKAFSLVSVRADDLARVLAVVEATKPEGRILTCVYCGHEYPQDTPAHGDKVLTDHITGCEKHPMREVIEQRDKLRSALVGLVGASSKEELDQMEMGVRLLPTSEEDLAVTLNAISALREATP